MKSTTDMFASPTTGTALPAFPTMPQQLVYMQPMQTALPMQMPLAYMMNPQQGIIQMPIAYVDPTAAAAAGSNGRFMAAQQATAGIPIPFQMPVAPMLPVVNTDAVTTESVVPSPASSTTDTDDRPYPKILRPGAWVDGRNLIVTNLPDHVTEDILRDMFAQFGEVSRVHVVSEKGTSKSRGFGFVEYTDTEASKRAIEQKRVLRPPPGPDGVESSPVFMTYGKRSKENRKSNSIYIGGFGSALNLDDLLHLCRKFGDAKSGKVLDIRKHSDGVAFIKFRKPDTAELVCNALDGSEVMCKPDVIKTLRVRLPDEVGKLEQSRRK
eukprot:TRINITY_DN2786_c2_g1_i1.p1 TRINITY_DN2786_c2_g1~~TRINITY_DN2786_c2_g1_i1.p1  ORF type:complete len:324 (+),score=38.27 TRINITY_DN2786_c2_g1_i1:36-1007(+)